MSRPRLHRRRARDELLAPWVAAAVILCGWGLAARYVAPKIAETSSPSATGAAPAPDADSPAAPAHAVLTSPAAPPVAEDRDVGSAGASAPASTSPDLETLRARNLLIPVAGVDRSALVSSFADARSGNRAHEALDVLAPRGTPVVAVEAGTIVKLFRSVRGGTTIYQFDSTGAFCYYYAHLDAYEPGLAEGDAVEQGETIGYVGTSGNAQPDTPHLHFAISRLGPERQWWDGVPIDPYLVLR